MLYWIWICAWVISQRLMMAAGIIVYQGILRTILTAIISALIAWACKNSKLMMTLMTVLVLGWICYVIDLGEVINGLVGGGLDLALLLIAYCKRDKDR